MFRLIFAILLALGPCHLRADTGLDGRAFIDRQMADHPNFTGTLILEKGQDSLLARAWLADHARRSIDVQYFIWSTDNIGILASEALLRAAERGVRVRVIVDDLLMDAPDKTLLALALHPNIDIRIYNPVHSVGVPWKTRLLNLVTDFRGANQRMHDKTFIVDGELAITGGRNMADEYFDFDHEYNFRDRDVLLLGPTVASMRNSFERFWSSQLTVPVEVLYEGFGLLRENVEVSDREVQEIYRFMHVYAAAGENFEPEIRHAIQRMPVRFPELAAHIRWGDVRFISDEPGKNSGESGLGGGGHSTYALAKLVDEAREEVLIQSPYLVLSDAAVALFARARSRGVKVRISTNSLASTDNIQAFSGYRNQREELLKMGLEIHEYKPDPEIQRDIMQRYDAMKGAAPARAPIFALHAKSLVVDRSVVFIGTYNLDPRSENLNTEVGVVIQDAQQAAFVRNAILTDMSAENSWNAQDGPDQFASFGKRMQVWFWQWMPIKPLL